MEDKLSIRVNVAERFYPLKIERKDEETIRRAAKLINEKILQYKQKYTDKDTQDFLAMVALQYVIKVLEKKDAREQNELINELESLNEELGLYIKSIE